MDSKIDFPNEETMKVTDLDKLKSALDKIYHSYHTYKSTKKDNKLEISELKNCLGKMKGYILVVDRKNLNEYFINFYNLNIVNLLDQFLELKIDNVSFAILDMIYFFVSNIKDNDFLEYLYKTQFPANIPDIPDIKINIIDKIILLEQIKNEEFLTYQINFMKSLALKINIDTLKYFYDYNINFFPLITKSFSLYNHSDGLIRNSVKNIFLSLIKIEDINLREFLSAFPINLYFSNLIFEFKNTIIDLCSTDFTKINVPKNYNLMLKYHDSFLDTVLYLNDLLSLKIDNINYILINCLLNEIILPLIVSIKFQSKEYLSIYHSLYILSFILFSIKNEFIYNVITFLLFKEEIPKPLYEKIIEEKFNKISGKIMKNINNIITNIQEADVNEENWKKISKIMKKTNGIDLSNGEIDFENIYDYIKNLMNYENEKIKNPFFENIKIYFLSHDDSVILNLNLIINTCINFYKVNKIENKENKLLKNKFFQVDLNDNISETIFNQLFKYLESSKDLRIATNEILIYNIQTFIQIFFENNKDKNSIEYKKKFAKRLLVILEKQINEINKILEKDKNILKYLYDSCLKTYDYYIKNINKKINDLITLSNILIPLEDLDKIEDIPLCLREDKYNYDFLKNNLLKLFFINDIINDLLDNKNNIIKNQKFPLVFNNNNLSMGKEYKLSELEEDCFHCKILKNKKYIKCEVVFSIDSVYFSEIIGGNFNDISNIKIFKKIPLRYLEIKQNEDMSILDIFDKTNKNTYKNSIRMNGIDVDNAKVLYYYFQQNIYNCQLLEQSMFNSFIEDIRKNISKILLD